MKTAKDSLRVMGFHVVEFQLLDYYLIKKIKLSIGDLYTLMKRFRSGDTKVQFRKLVVKRVNRKAWPDSSQVIAPTNRADILDPTVMRSGRLEEKIEFTHPT